jgi:hypothetical protein
MLPSMRDEKVSRQHEEFKRVSVKWFKSKNRVASRALSLRWDQFDTVKFLGAFRATRGIQKDTHLPKSFQIRV